MSLAGKAPVTRGTVACLELGSSVAFQTGFENDYYLLLNLLHGRGIARKIHITFFFHYQDYKSGR